MKIVWSQDCQYKTWQMPLANTSFFYVFGCSLGLFLKSFEKKTRQWKLNGETWNSFCVLKAFKIEIHIYCANCSITFYFLSFCNVALYSSSSLLKPEEMIRTVVALKWKVSNRLLKADWVVHCLCWQASSAICQATKYSVIFSPHCCVFLQLHKTMLMYSNLCMYFVHYLLDTWENLIWKQYVCLCLLACLLQTLKRIYTLMKIYMGNV